MLNTLLFAVLIVLTIINIAIALWKKVEVDIKPQLKDVENAVLKFQTSLEQNEKSIKDEFQRNRTETNEISKTNREELTKSLNLFGEQFNKNIKELNNLLDAKFETQNRQQLEFNQQTNEGARENREELSKSLKSFEENFSHNIKTLNELLRQSFGDFNKQQIEFNQQTNETSKTNREELINALNMFGERFDKNTKELNELLKAKFEIQNKQQLEFNQQVNDNAKENREELSKSLKSFEESFSHNIKELNGLLRQNFGDFSKQQIEINKLTTENIKQVENAIERQLKLIREDNTKQLDEMRKTVDEKLQKTLNARLSQSFETVEKQLQAVQEGLGEMKNLATDVGSLKKVLSNVKLRGGIGEIQLSMLLEQILAPDQYEANVKTKADSLDVVEFAIKLPGRDDSNKNVWLPIDAKFPKDVYEQLQDAYDETDQYKIQAAQKNLDNTIKKMAKDINEKYLDPPNTTDFGIMFLPFEGIYAEVVRKAALLEDLQKNYKIIVTGPTTLAAILNSLQMGFKTLAIQKRSSEVWQVLGAVKTEFNKFGGLMEKAQKNIQTGLNQLDDVMGKRTRAIERKLRGVEVLSEDETKKILPEISDTSKFLDDEENE